MQCVLGLMDEEVGVGGSAVEFVSFCQNIGDPFIGCGEMFGRFGFGKSVQRTHAQIDIEQIGGARRQRRTHHGNMDPIVVVPVAQPFSDVV